MSKKSAYTSLNQVPALFKNQLSEYYNQGKFKTIPDGLYVAQNLDIGGGKYDKGTYFLNYKGIDNVVYDPYNRSKEHNAMALEIAETEVITSITCLNVLNVITNKGSRTKLLKFIRRISHMNAARCTIGRPNIFFSIYEKRGDGKKDSSLTQNNMKTAEYVPEIQRVFSDRLVKRWRNVITVGQPIYHKLYQRKINPTFEELD